VQNLAPAGEVDPQEGHFSTFRDPPHDEQNFPDASAPQDGHFMVLYSPEIPSKTTPPSGEAQPIRLLR
jgi:hypothetical protein